MRFSRRQLLLASVAGLASLQLMKSRAFARALEETGLKDVFKGDFLMGTAIGAATFRNNDTGKLNLIAREFNSITAENEMKWERVHPEADKWNWEIPDQFVEFGQKNDMHILGHVLVWHSQVPAEVFTNADGKQLDRNQLLKRMEDHISTLVGRYKGRIDAWDAVNEAIDEDKGWRKSKWFDLIGPDFVEKAFHFAHDVDSRAQLLYNDYNMHDPGKRKFLLKAIKQYKKKGVPIHGVGMQGHVGLTYPDLREFEKSIVAYAREGMRVHITELDVDVLPVAWEHTGAEISTLYEARDELNPYTKGLPKNVEKELNDRYVQLFKLFLKHRDKIDRVTFWGTSDAESWKNNFPVRGRTNYPLLFDRQLNRKEAYHAVTSLKK